MFFLISDTSAQIGEFEGDVRITESGLFASPSLEMYLGTNRLTSLLGFANGTELSSYNGDLTFKVSDNGSAITRMTIAASTGNVGIGLSGASHKLDISHNSSTTNAHLRLNETGADDYSRIKFTNSGSAGIDYWDIAGKANGAIIGAGVSNNTSELNIFYQANGGTGANYLKIVPQEASSFSNSLTGSIFYVRGHHTPTFDNVYTSGSLSRRWRTIYSANGTIQTSDIRLKKNINTLTYGIEEVMQLNPVSYDWKNNSNSQPIIGLIAQEVLEVVPEVVQAQVEIMDPLTGEKKMVKPEIIGMNYSSLIPVLINSIQEQQAMIEELKDSNQQLETMILEIKNKK